MAIRFDTHSAQSGIKSLGKNGSKKHILGFFVSLMAMSVCTAQARDLLEHDTVIDHESVKAYSSYLDETLTELIATEHLAIKVGETESFPVHPAYAKLSKDYAGKTKLGQTPGELRNYISGRPFSESPNLDDPKAGEKIAWNMRYGFHGDSGTIKPFYWQYRNMRTAKVERELSFQAANLRFKHRTVLEPIPEIKINPSGIFNALYLQVLEPADIRNTQLLIHRLDDDTQQEQGWLYLGNQRRVRRLPTGQNTDAFLGSDVMIEDFLGYNGRIMDMTWTYLGTQEVLLPFYRHNDLPLSDRTAGEDFRFVDFGGKGGCFPEVTWQLRKAYLLEAKPVLSTHPLAKRLYYVDAETYLPAYGRLYDRSGKLWKFAIAAYSHPDHHLESNKGSYVPILDAVAMIDLQAQHCTTMQARTEVNKTDLRPAEFMVQELRRRGR